MINDDVAVRSMWDKRRYATHIVSNLTFKECAPSRHLCNRGQRRATSHKEQ
jgi:methylenetetrahydrofolate reductase (NADPH)